MRAKDDQMIDFTEVKLHNIVVHNIGNSLQEEGMKLSKGPLVFKESIVKDLLMKYFYHPLKVSFSITFSMIRNWRLMKFTITLLKFLMILIAFTFRPLTYPNIFMINPIIIT